MWRFHKGWCRCRDLERFGLIAAVSSRALGDRRTAKSISLLARSAGFSRRWAAGKQVHGRAVRIVTRPTAPVRIPAVDGLITKTPGLLLAVTVADCVPVFIVDPVRRVNALVHAGWRGVRGRILSAAVRKMTRRFGSRPADLRLSLGPHIRSCCYEVGRDVAGLFPRKTVIARRSRLCLDLSRCLRDEARRLGVRAAHFSTAPHCTKHDVRFFSFRREKTKKRNVSFLGIKP